MVLEKGYGLLVAKFKDYELFVLHFRITDYYWSLVQLYFQGYIFFTISGYRLFPKFTQDY